MSKVPLCCLIALEEICEECKKSKCTDHSFLCEECGYFICYECSEKIKCTHCTDAVCKNCISINRSGDRVCRGCDVDAYDTGCCSDCDGFGDDT